MKHEDMLMPGEKAQRLLRVSSSLSLLAGMRTPSLQRVKVATNQLRAREPEVAAALIVHHMKRLPLHERKPWVNEARMALEEYRLGENTDPVEALLAMNYLDGLALCCQAEIDRREKINDRLQMALLAALVATFLGMLSYAGHKLLNPQMPQAPNPAPQIAAGETAPTAPANPKKAPATTPTPAAPR
jgi:hypothetical protein